MRKVYSRKIAVLLLFSLAFRTTSTLYAQTGVEQSDSLILLNLSIDQYVVSKNIAALDTLYASDFVFSHGSGRVEGKTGWMKTVGRATYSRRDHDSVNVELHPELAVVKGIMHIVKNNPSRKDRYHLKYIRIYTRRNGNWKLISHNTTKETHDIE